MPTYPLSTGWVNANELFSQTGVKIIPHTILRNIIEPIDPYGPYHIECITLNTIRYYYIS